MPLKKRENISNKRNLVKNPNWQEADQLAIYKACPKIWAGEHRETNPDSGRVEETRTRDLRLTTPAP